MTGQPHKRDAQSLSDWKEKEYSFLLCGEQGMNGKEGTHGFSVLVKMECKE